MNQGETRRLVGYWFKKRIDRRLDIAFANPNLTPEQKEELFASANTLISAFQAKGPVTRSLGEEFVKLSDSLMGPKNAPGEQG